MAEVRDAGADEADAAVLIGWQVGFSLRARGTVRYSALLTSGVPGSPNELPGQLDPCERAFSGLLCVSLGASHF